MQILCTYINVHNFNFKEQQVYPRKGISGTYQNSFIRLVNTSPLPLGVRSHSQGQEEEVFGEEPSRQKEDRTLRWKSS